MRQGPKLPVRIGATAAWPLCAQILSIRVISPFAESRHLFRFSLPHPSCAVNGTKRGNTVRRF
jgi:hypothetical protein